MNQPFQTKLSYYFLFCLTSLILLISCSQEESFKELPVFYANDFSINVDENPTVSQFVGQIVARSEVGKLNFEIIDEFPVGSLNVDSNTGEITIKDPSKFDWEVYRSVMVRVQVSNGSKSKLIFISIQILDQVEQDNYLLKQMIERKFDDKGDVSYEIETIYELGKMTERYQNTRNFKGEKFYYNDQGLMSEQVIYESGVLYETIRILYDDTFRIISIEHERSDPNMNWKVDYSYPTDNEILAQQSNNQGITDEKRFVLQDGMVIEEWVDQYDPMFIAAYQDGNIHYYFDQVSDVYYTYEETGTNPHRYYEKMFAKIPSNIVLYHENLDSATDFFTDRLIKEKRYQNDLPFTVRFDYELNEVDLAVYAKETMEEAGITRLIGETEYVFEKRTKEGGLISYANTP